MPREKFTRRNIKHRLKFIIRLFTFGKSRGVDKEYLRFELQSIVNQMDHGLYIQAESTTEIVPKKLCSRVGCGHHKYVHRPRCLKCIEEDREQKCREFMNPRHRTEIVQVEIKPNNEEINNEHR